MNLDHGRMVTATAYKLRLAGHPLPMADLLERSDAQLRALFDAAVIMLEERLEQTPVTDSEMATLRSRKQFRDNNPGFVKNGRRQDRSQWTTEPAKALPHAESRSEHERRLQGARMRSAHGLDSGARTSQSPRTPQQQQAMDDFLNGQTHVFDSEAFGLSSRVATTCR